MPSPEQLAALLAAPVASKHASTSVSKPAVFTLTAPHVLLQGAAVRVVCYVPESLGAGVIRFGLEGVRVSGPTELHAIENALLIERLECGHWKAVCAVHTVSGDRYAEQDIEVRGATCADDGG